MLASLLNTLILLSGAEVTTLEDPGTTTGSAAVQQQQRCGGESEDAANTLGYSSVVVFGDSFSDNGE